VSYFHVVATATAPFKDVTTKLLGTRGPRGADAASRAFPRIRAVKFTVHKPPARSSAISSDMSACADAQPDC